MISEGAFVNVRTMFQEGPRPTVDKLAEVYSNPKLLVEAIGSLTEGRLTREAIQGKRVLLKPNWVRHQLVPNDRHSLCTNESFILAALDIVLAHKPASVIVGDAPIQGCKWERLISKGFYSEIDSRRKKSGLPIDIKDFRRVIFDVEANDLTQARDTLDEFIIFDVGNRSYLEPITHPRENRFRVTVYNPDRFTLSHRPGVHKYCIARDVFDSDVVISLPKIKTHQKTGITAALKNIVGINGDKDFLPHHRIGGTTRGGDCYPGGSLVRYLAELSYDQGNRNRGRWRYKFWTRLGAALWNLSLPSPTHQVAAGWYGNDTTWRMVMDLNLIVTFGRKDGSLAETPQRTMFSLCDGIVGGQGNGPLEAEPLNLGVITFTNNSALNDLCCAMMMNMDVDRIPLLIAAASTCEEGGREIHVNGVREGLQDLRRFGVDVVMPPGWRDYRRNSPMRTMDRLMARQY